MVEKERTIDFFDVKGIISALMDSLGVGEWQLKPAKNPMFHPGRSAEVWLGRDKVGVLGELHPEVSKVYGLKNSVGIVELKLEALVKHARLIKEFHPLPRYPGVSLDVALIVDKEITNEIIEGVIREAGGKFLEEVKLFDLYEGGQIPKGKRSLAYSLLYRAADRTLDFEEVRKFHENVTKKLEKLGAKVRKK